MLRRQQLCNKKIELYLHILYFILPIITNFNIEFQSERPQIHTLYQKLTTAYKTILAFYIQSNIVNSNDVSQIRYRDPTCFLPNNKVGGKCTGEIVKQDNHLSATEKDEFVTNRLNFYIECCHQMYLRFPFNSSNVIFFKTLLFIEAKT